MLVPFWAVWPFETLVLPRAHDGALPDLAADERDGLADVLRRFSANPTEIRFGDLDFCTAGDDTTIVLSGSGGRPGMRRLGEGRTFRWTLDAAQAEEAAEPIVFRARLSGLAGSANPAS